MKLVWAGAFLSLLKLLSILDISKVYPMLEYT